MAAYADGIAVPSTAFPEWGASDDPSIILTCDLTSLSAVTAAGGSEIGAGSKTYSENGVLLSTTSGLKFTGLTTAQKTALTRGGTLTCWVEKGYIDGLRLTTSHEYLLGMYGVTPNKYNSVDRYSASYASELFLNSLLGSTGDRALASIIGKNDYVRVDFSRGPKGRPTLYLDNFPHTQHSTGKWPDTIDDYENIIIGGKVSTPTCTGLHKIKNMMVSTRPIHVPMHYSLSSIFISGHSYAAQGDYMTNFGVHRALSGSGSRDDGCDASMTPTLHRELYKRGLGMGGDRIWNYSYGGASVRSATGGLAYQIAAYKAAHSRFSKVFLFWGANEIVASANSWLSDFGPSGSIEDWETNFKTQVDVMIAAGADTFYLLNQPYLSTNHPSATGQIYRDRVDGLNTMLQSVVNYINDSTTATGYVVDVWTALGGISSSSTSNWGGFSGTDQAHPNLATSNIFGQLAANKLIGTI